MDRTVQQLIQQVTPGRLLSYGAAAIPIAARLLGFAEFGPLGVAVGVVSILGMAWDDWAKAQKH